MDRDTAIDLLCADPRVTGIVSDFDGVLSDIVNRPEDASPAEGATAAMTSLARSFRLVAVLSGRSLEDLGSRFSPKGAVLLGSYGRERTDRPGPRRRTGGWEPVSISAASRTIEMPGVVVEHKGAGIALHYRLAPARADEVRALAAELAEEFELEVRPGRLVAELVAPGPGKGDAVEELVSDHGLQAMLYAGDDIADIEAFERARSLVPAVLVAVHSEESPDALRELADIVLASPGELVDLLMEIARRAA